jgi:hypothetical protein
MASLGQAPSSAITSQKESAVGRTRNAKRVAAHQARYRPQFIGVDDAFPRL